MLCLALGLYFTQKNTRVIAFPLRSTENAALRRLHVGEVVLGDGVLKDIKSRIWGMCACRIL